MIPNAVLEYADVTPEQVCAAVEWLADRATGMSIGEWCEQSRVLLGAAATIHRLQSQSEAARSE